MAKTEEVEFMAKTEEVFVRLDSQLKANVDQILTRLGLTSSDVVNLLYRQIELSGGLPFEFKLPRKKNEAEAHAEAEAYAAIMASVEEVEKGAKPIPLIEAFEKLEVKYVK